MPSLKEDLEKKKKKPSLFEGTETGNRWARAQKGEGMFSSTPQPSGSFTFGPNGEIQNFRSPTTHPIVEEGGDAATSPEERVDDKDKINKLLEMPELPQYKSLNPEPYFKDRIKALEDEAAKLPEARKSTWEDEVAATKAWAEEAKNNLDKREFIEKITQAVGQLAAGWYGLKHGMDMSGLQFDKTDWQAKLADMRGEQGRMLAEADKRESLRRQDAAELRRDREGIQNRLEALKGRLVDEKYRGSQKESDASYQQAMASWNMKAREVMKAKEDLAGGRIKTSDVRQLKDSYGKKNKDLLEAQNLLNDGEEDAAYAKLISIYGDDPRYQATMKKAKSWFRDEEGILGEFIESEMASNVAAMRQFEEMEKQAAGVSGAASSPVVAVIGSDGNTYNIPKDKLEAALKADPGARLAH